LDPAANGRIDNAVNTMNAIRADAPNIEKSIRDFLERYNGELTGGAQPVNVERYAGPFKVDNFQPLPRTFTNSVRDPCHHFPDQLVIFGTDSTVDDLSVLYLRPRADAQSAQVESLRGGYSGLCAQFQQQAQTINSLAPSLLANPSNPSGGQQLEDVFHQWLSTAEELGRTAKTFYSALNDLLTVYVTYTDLCGELGGQPRMDLIGQAGNLSLGEWKARAHHQFKDSDSAMRFLEGYWKAQNGPAEPVHTVLYVDNPQPLNLSGKQVYGKIVIVSTGAVKLSDVKLADQGRDVLVVCAGGPLTVSGHVEASLIAHKGISCAADTQLIGNLILLKVSDPRALKGRLQNPDKHYYSGITGSFKGAYTHVLFAPWSADSNVSRK
jgi:hypothetical protein